MQPTETPWFVVQAVYATHMNTFLKGCQKAKTTLERPLKKEKQIIIMLGWPEKRIPFWVLLIVWKNMNLE